MNAAKMRLSRRVRLWFLRRFPEFRAMEKESERLAGLAAKHGEAQQLSAAIIQSYKKDEKALLKKIDSDSYLIDSMNRHIAALEGKADMQAQMLAETNQRLKALLSRKRR